MLTEAAHKLLPVPGKKCGIKPVEINGSKRGSPYLVSISAGSFKFGQVRKRMNQA